MKKIIFLLIAVLFAEVSFSQVNIQAFYDFGSEETACSNQRTNRVTTTVEGLHFDKFGNTFYFVDFDYSINSQDPEQTIFGGYWEIARCLNFWNKSKAKDLSIHVEYDGGLGIYKGGGYGINHAALLGLDYFLYTPDFNNTFNLKLLGRYDAGSPKTIVPLQFTFVWNCKDIGGAKGLAMSGFIDIFGQGDNFVIITEPQIWYNIGQWFKCPKLDIGTEVELSYNFTGSGFMANPCLGLRWRF